MDTNIPVAADKICPFPPFSRNGFRPETGLHFASVPAFKYCNAPCLVMTHFTKMAGTERRIAAARRPYPKPITAN